MPPDGLPSTSISFTATSPTLCRQGSLCPRRPSGLAPDHAEAAAFQKKALLHWSVCFILSSAWSTDFSGCRKRSWLRLSRDDASGRLIGGSVVSRRRR